MKAGAIYEKNSFGQGLAVFLVVIGIFTLLVLLVKLVSLSALSQATTISRQQIAVIVICISLIVEVVLRIAIHHISINHQAAVHQVVITIN